MKFELDKFGRHIKNEELIADLKKVASDFNLSSLTQKEYKNNGKFGVAIFFTRFGSWGNALAKAGLGSSRRRIKINDNELILDLKRVSSNLKNNSITRDEYNRHGKFHSATLEERFGSWIKAKKIAGLRRRKHPSISDEEYFRNLEEVWIKLGKQPRFSDMKIPFSKYSGSGYVHNFGTWRKALERFIEYINEDEENNKKNDDSVINQEKIPFEEPLMEHPKKKINSKAMVQKPLAARPKSSQRAIDKHQTKRAVNDRLRFKVMKRDNFKCQCCGKSPAVDPKTILHVDHIKPWTKGGETVLENLQTLCSKCNIGKSNLH